MMDTEASKPRGRDTTLWFALSAAVGVAVEIVVSVLGKRKESWDSPSYWMFGLPAMILAAFICGLFARGNPVRIGYAPFMGQMVTMLIRTGAGSMLPLGIMFMGIIGITGVLAAFAGVAIGKRLLPRPHAPSTPAPTNSQTR